MRLNREPLAHDPGVPARQRRPMSLHSPFRNFFHAGYVVLDMAKVVDNMTARFGVEEWKILPLPAGSPAKAIGFAYVQESMIELVELDLAQELLPIHRGLLPHSDSEARLNHLTYMLDSEEELTA